MRHRWQSHKTGLAALAMVLSSCGAAVTTTTLNTTTGGAPATPTPGAITTSVTTSTTSTTTLTLVTTTTTPLPTVTGMVLATEDGVTLVMDGETTQLVSGRSIDFVLPDLTGGVIFQGAGQYEQEWPPQPIPIEWIAASGVDPIVVVDGEGANALTPLQVAWIDGPQLLYRRMTALDEDDQTEHLVMKDLSSGAERVLGITGGYESSRTTVDVGGEQALITWVGYGGEGACIGVADLSDLLNLDATDWVGTICGADCCVYGPTPGCGFGVPCAQGPTGAIRTAISPDGGSFAMITKDSDESWSLQRVDLETGEPRLVAEVELPDGEWPTWVDFDGSNFLVVITSDDGTRKLLHIDASGELVNTIDARFASFWMTEAGPLP